MELNREKILKSLEACRMGARNCDKCSYIFICDKLYTDAIELIKELTEDLHATRTELTRVQEENERLRNRITATIILTDKDAEKIKNECLKKVQLDKKAIQAATVRKMQERLKAHFDTYTDADETTALYMRNLIDQIAKELLEGE